MNHRPSHPTGSPAGPAAPVRVFLLDDHEVVRRGVRDLLEAEPDIVVVGEAANAREALARVPAVRPDVAVLDVRLGNATGGDHEGVEVCRELRAELPDLACLMLTSFDDDEALFDAIMAGAAGYVLKQIGGSDLITAVRTVATGRSLLDPRMTSRVMARIREPEPDPAPTAPGDLDRLSPRELEILDLIGLGLTNRQIADRLYLAEKTVKNRVSAILGKLGVGRRVQAAVIAGRLRETQGRGTGTGV
ncbi:response regulator transcription factor [Streptomyces sp. NPDC048623]|uniref:response regulator transcription factor n=1 Tax=Streptomyces sp. NPDC048623 TaxID=3155761 RepID=UPI003439631A